MGPPEATGFNEAMRNGGESHEFNLATRFDVATGSCLE